MNIFLVTSPLQYICAEEALYEYKTNNNILVLVEQNEESGIKHLKNVFNEKKWDTVIKIKSNQRTITLPKVIKRINSLSKNKEIEHFFFGEYKSFRTRLFMRNITCKKWVFFDDGMATLFDYYDYIHEKRDFTRNRFLQDIILRIQGCKPIGTMPFSEKLEIFTMFDIPDCVCQTKKNNLTTMRLAMKAHECYSPSAPVGFIGEGAIGDKFGKREQPSKAEYLQQLKDYRASTESTIIYFPHRTETEDVKLEVMKIDNLLYHNTELPLELEIATKKIKLSKLTGIASTALYTLSILYKEIPIDAHKINMLDVERINSVIERHFKERTI
tara:strand:+ start:1521 stop:2504 length:984 start_codon:yes stop_codon:yes gene_type:complete